MNYKPYKKEFPYSYTIGVFPTLELLHHRLDLVEKVILHSKGEENTGCEKIVALCKEHHIPVEINNKLIQRMSKKGNCYALGIFKKEMVSLAKDEHHIVLVHPGDMGNLGTIIRTVLGFGIRHIAIIRPGVDAYDPKVIRGSMGSFFHVRIEYFDDFSSYAEKFDHDMYTFRLDGAEELPHVMVEEGKPYALLFGNESSGLPASFNDIGTGVVIPHSDAIDSMNLSIAVGIAVYHFQLNHKK